jgi:hypothetical protein
VAHFGSGTVTIAPPMASGVALLIIMNIITAPAALVEGLVGDIVATNPDVASKARSR